ncbi:unnamed protein product, partial [Brassica oleracea]
WFLVHPSNPPLRSSEPRRGGERRRSCCTSPSLDAGIFTIHHRSAPLP